MQASRENKSILHCHVVHVIYPHGGAVDNVAYGSFLGFFFIQSYVS